MILSAPTANNNPVRCKDVPYGNAGDMAHVSWINKSVFVCHKGKFILDKTLKDSQEAIAFYEKLGRIDPDQINSL